MQMEMKNMAEKTFGMCSKHLQLVRIQNYATIETTNMNSLQLASKLFQRVNNKEIYIFCSIDLKKHSNY